MRDETFDGLTRWLAASTRTRRSVGRIAVVAGIASFTEKFSMLRGTEAEAAGKNCRPVNERRVKRYIKRAAKRYNQPYKKMLCVAECESQFNSCAFNPDGRSIGVFQFKRGTWDTTKYRNKDIWNPKWNALAAAWMWNEGRENEWDCCCPRWNCDCPGNRPSWC